MISILMLNKMFMQPTTTSIIFKKKKVKKQNMGICTPCNEKKQPQNCKADAEMGNSGYKE